MTDGQDGGIDRYTQLLLESIGKLSGQTEELNHRYAALDKTICLLKQAYEASLQADHQVMADLITQRPGNRNSRPRALQYRQCQDDLGGAATASLRTGCGSSNS